MDNETSIAAAESRPRSTTLKRRGWILWGAGGFLAWAVLSGVQVMAYNGTIWQAIGVSSFFGLGGLTVAVLAARSGFRTRLTLAIGGWIIGEIGIAIGFLFGWVISYWNGLGFVYYLPFCVMSGIVSGLTAGIGTPLMGKRRLAPMMWALVAFLAYFAGATLTSLLWRYQDIFGGLTFGEIVRCLSLFATSGSAAAVAAAGLVNWILGKRMAEVTGSRLWGKGYITGFWVIALIDGVMLVVISVLNSF